MPPASLSGRAPIYKTAAVSKFPALLQCCVETALQFLPMLKVNEKYTQASCSG
jgi:hypothetical protein